MRWLALALLGLVGCTGGGDDGGDTDTDVDSDVTFPTPTLAIAAPAADAVVPGSEVAVELTITDFALVGPEASASVAPLPPVLALLVGTAAAHDVREAPQGYVALTLDGAAAGELAATTATLHDVAPGEHHLRAELLWPDGDGFYPAILDEVAFTVASPE